MKPVGQQGLVWGRFSSERLLYGTVCYRRLLCRAITVCLLYPQILGSALIIIYRERDVHKDVYNGVICTDKLTVNFINVQQCFHLYKNTLLNVYALKRTGKPDVLLTVASAAESRDRSL